MNNLHQALSENIGKWMVLNTKSGAFYGKIESVNNQGVTVLLPDHYTVDHPSVRLIENNIKGTAEDVHAAQRFFRRPFFFRRRFRRLFFPFFFFNPFFI